VAKAGGGVSSRTTALQLIPAEERARLDVWRANLAPREYVVAVDILFRLFEEEWRRTEPERRRWSK
jgi:hypothetical protein